MGSITSIAYNPTICLRIFSQAITVSTGFTVIASAITMTVVISVVLTSKSSKDPFHQQTTVLVQSISIIVFNRQIRSYELDYYSDATDTLLTVAEELNNHLKEKFPKNFAKTIISNFSKNPVSKFTRRRRRRQPSWSHNSSPFDRTATVTLWNGSPTPDIDDFYGSSTRARSESPSISSSTTTTTTTTTTGTKTDGRTLTTTVTASASTTTTKTSGTTLTKTTTSTSITTTTSTTVSISASLLTNTITPTDVQNTSTSNCNISMFNDTERSSVIYVHISIYFNVTNVNDIIAQQIIKALDSLYPSITLISKCSTSSLLVTVRLMKHCLIYNHHPKQTSASQS